MHVQMLFLLALTKDELISYIKPKGKYIIYSDPMHNSKVTHRIEIVPLMLYRSVFYLDRYNENIDLKINDEVVELLMEMRFINNRFLEDAERGRFCDIDLTYHLDAKIIFWEINQRYAKVILNKLNIDLQKPRFDFIQSLKHFGIDAVELTEEDFMVYLYST